MEKQLEPRIRQFYRGGENWQTQQMDWSPLVYVKTTAPHVLNFLNNVFFLECLDSFSNDFLG